MKNILILGATSAIAQATARLYARQDNHLALVGRNPAHLQAIAADLRTRGVGAVSAYEADLSNISQITGVLEQIDSTLNVIDIALIAYGTLPSQPNCAQNMATAQAQFQVNFLSTVLLSEAIAQRMANQQGGTLAVISSVAGDRGRQSNYYYGAAKGGLSIFLQGLRNRYLREGVNVLTIKPGFVDTPMTREFNKGLLWVSPEKIAAGIVKAIEKKKQVVYLPWFWRGIMLVIRHIPERIFSRLKL